LLRRLPEDMVRLFKLLAGIEASGLIIQVRGLRRRCGGKRKHYGHEWDHQPSSII
jgi:hypothetical protein